MELALSGFLFEDAYKSQSLDFPAFCALAQDAGYDGVELRRTQISAASSREQRRQVLRCARAHGLSITCLTARGMPAAGAERERFFHDYLQLCRDLDCRLLKVGGEAPWLRRAAAAAATFGVVLASNNHVGGPLATVAGTRAHLQAVGHPNYGLLFDCLHLTLAGEDYLAALPTLTRYTRNVLVQGLRPAAPDAPEAWEHGGCWWQRALPGDAGAQDWQAVFGAFQEAGYDGLVTVIEHGWPLPQRQAVALRCAAALRSAWTRRSA